MFRRWAAAFALLFCSVALQAAGGLLSATVSPGLRAVLDEDQQISLAVTPHDGDAWSRLSLRVTGKSSNWKTIAEANGMGDNLTRHREVLVPLPLARPELQKQAVAALFPADRATPDGWMHRVVLGTGIEGESLWKIAEWFTGDGANYGAIRTANSFQRLSTRKGDSILVPAKLLLPPYRSAASKPVREDVKTVSNAEDDPSDSSAQAVVPAVERYGPDLPPAAEASPAALEYDLKASEPFAVYRLQKGEALYSSVVIRFTGRVYAKDVNEGVDRIVQFNGIADVSRMPVGYAVKIPLEMLDLPYRPSSDPRRLAAEESKRESARVAKRVPAKNLKGVTVIIDAGHGGRDVGTSHDGMWESSYVYDVASRLKKELEKKTDARVYMTTRSRGLGYSIPDDDRLEGHTDHVVLTSPEYTLDNPVVGVHLRWYLANSIFRKAIRKGPEEKVVFLSLHADSLHPSLRGAMAYIPGEQYVQGTFTKKGNVYLARSEVKESPSVTQTEDDALRAEGLSNELADSVMESFRDAGLGVHSFSPIRSNVVRDGREWVPAVIRYNLVPARMLLEICNLGNDRDRRLMATRAYRQNVATALRKGIIDYFEQRQKATPESEIASRTAGR